MFPLLGPATKKQIEMINDACHGLNRAGSVFIRWVLRLIVAAWEYPARRRERRRRRNFRAATGRWVQEYIDSIFDEMEMLLIRQPDFLSAIRDAMIHSDLDPQMSYFDWDMPIKATWKKKLIERFDRLPEWVKAMCLTYLIIVGGSALAVGVAFGLYYFVHVIAHLAAVTNGP